jgi:HAE1 family hydrophobic/amphiphilic exporter-1
MKLAQFSVNRPVTTVMIFIAGIVLGFMSLLLLGIDLMPEFEVPAVSVMTAYQGAGPEEIETLITEPLEDALSTVSGVDEVISLSKEGLSAITLRFEWGQEIDETINDVRDKIDQAKAIIPEEAEEPAIIKFDIAMMPIMIIAITAEDSFPNLQTIVKNNIVDPLKRVKGVASAFERGGLVRQIRVDVDHDKLTALNLSVSQINAALAAANMSIPGGNIKSGYKDYLLRTPEEFSNAEEVAEVVIAQRNDIAIKLKDVADVRDFFQERTYDVRINGKTGMAVFVQKQSGENTVAVTRAVRAELERIKKNLPPDVEPRIVMDNSEFILASVYNLRDNVLWAIIFVGFVILFFLRSLRASLIVAISIPTSLVITFLLMYLAGYTINTTTLAALAVAVGEVVDNAIVVVDNIHRHRQKGQRLRESSILGTNEVGVAVMASTLTTIAIFAPIMFVGGITKIFFGQFAMIMVMALGASLFTAIMLVPMLCSKFLKMEEQSSQNFALRFFYNAGENVLTWIEDIYVRFLNWSLVNRKTVLVTCAVIFAGCLGLAGFVGTEFFPEEDQNRVMANFELPVGTRHERTGAVAQQFEKIVENNVPEKNVNFVRWGVYGTAGGGHFATEEETYKGIMFMGLVPKIERQSSPRDVINRLRKITDKMPDATIRYSAEDPLAGMMFSSGGKLAVELYGHSMTDATAYAEAVKTALAQIPGVTDIDIGRKEEKPELKVIVDREKASKLGLDIRTIGKTIETFFAGTTATRYREMGDEYDVEVRLRPDDRTKPEDLRDVFVGSPGGEQINLANIATIDEGVGPTKIERKDQARYITVSADISGRDLGSVVADAKKAIDKVAAPSGFSYKFAGAEKERKEAFQMLIIATALGMVLVYMVMASQFESYRDPFIIFLSVPFGIVGVIMALAITGFAMNVVTFIALILLVGLVVNNGIVLISFIGILRHRGYDTYQAIVEGGRSRLRPILSTTLTTLLGLSPLLFTRGAGSEVWVPFAVTSISGLSLSTLITLIMMPTLYSIFEGVKIPTRDEGRETKDEL